MEPRIIDKDAITLVGLASFGGDVGDLWTRIETCEDLIAHALPGLWYELHLYPADFSVGTPTYMVAREVTCVEDVPHAMLVKPLPAGKWAAFTHRCGAEGYDAVNQRVNDWLAVAPYRHARNLSLQIYDHRFKGFADPDSRLDLLIPIAPKDASP